MKNKLAVFFRPGIIVMSRFRLMTKFLMVSIILLGLLVLSLYQFFSANIESQKFSQKEVYGVEYAGLSKQLTQQIQQYYFQKDAGSSDRADKVLLKLKDLDQKYHHVLYIPEQKKDVSKDIDRCLELWQQMKLGQDVYAELFTAITTMHTDISDTSNLTLDPDLDSYYCMDIVMFRSLAIADRLYQIRELVEKQKSGPLSYADKKTMITLCTQIAGLSDTVNTDLQTGITFNAAKSKPILASVQPQAGQFKNTYANLLKRVDDDLSKENRPLTVTTAEIDYAIALNGQLFDQLNEALWELCSIRVKGYATTAKVVFVAVGLTLPIFAYICLALVLSITKSVDQIRNGLVKIQKGDLSCQIQSESQDELAQIADGINEMLFNMREILQKIAQVAQHLTESANQLTTSVEQSAQNSNEIAVTINNLASGAEKQHQSVEQTSLAIDQIASTVQQLSTGADTITVTSQQSAQASQEGNEAVQNSIEQMSNIRDKVAKSATVIRKLGERSQAIGSIVDTIAAITKQTNLLALNAAIEAARAGEQGRGFAVVANEVRCLAEQSQKAAEQIADLIQKIQSDTEKAVVAMQDGTQEVETGEKVVARAGASFQIITERIAAVSGQAETISAAIGQIAAGSKNMVVSVNSINDICKAAVGQTQNVSAATEEQSATEEEIAASSQGLSQVAEELQAAVRKFQL